MATVEAPRLAAQRISVTLGARTLLAAVDFAIDGGEVAVIDGPSGAGKSTFLRALASLQPLSTGRLLLDGVPLEAVSASRYRTAVAYIAQQPVMFTGSVADNLRAGPGLRGEVLEDDGVAELLTRVALSPAFSLREARDLSGGEKQRVAIARALANTPKVVLFDEPTSALDPSAAEEILGLVRACAASGAAVVVVTHSRAHAGRLGGSNYECRAGALTRIS